jgi:hypothetical protein
MEIMSHHRRAEIAAEKQSPFRPHQGLVAPDQFLETMLDRRIGETHSIDCAESLGTIYRNKFQTYHQRVKLTEMFSWESLFIPLQLGTCQSRKSSMGVNSQGRSTKKVKLLLNGNHFKPQPMRLQHHHGDDDLE